jgi:hypothetical protein
MRNRPRIGDQVGHEVTVGPEMTARLFDREIHHVYGTAWMVRHVEEAAGCWSSPTWDRTRTPRVTRSMCGTSARPPWASA